MGPGRPVRTRVCRGEILRGPRARRKAELVLLYRESARWTAPGRVERECSQHRDILELGRRIRCDRSRVEESALLEPTRMPPTPRDRYLQSERRPAICPRTSQSE